MTSKDLWLQNTSMWLVGKIPGVTDFKATYEALHFHTLKLFLGWKIHSWNAWGKLDLRLPHKTYFNVCAFSLIVWCCNLLHKCVCFSVCIIIAILDVFLVLRMDFEKVVTFGSPVTQMVQPIGVVRSEM